MLKKILLLGIVILGFINISFADYVLDSNYTVPSIRAKSINCFSNYCLLNGDGWEFFYNIKDRSSKNPDSYAGSDIGLFINYNSKLYYLSYHDHYDHDLNNIRSVSPFKTVGKFSNYKERKDTRITLYNDSLFLYMAGDEQHGYVIYQSGNDVIFTGYDVSNIINKYSLQSLDLSNIGVVDYNTNTKYLQLRTVGGAKVPGYKFYWGGLDKVSLFELLTGNYAFTNELNVDTYISNIYQNDLTGKNEVKQYFYIPDYEQLSGNISDFGKSTYDGYIVDYGGQKYFMDKFKKYQTGAVSYNYYYFDIPNFSFYHCYFKDGHLHSDKYDISSYFTTDNVASDTDFNQNVNFGGNSSSSNTTIISNNGDVVIPSNLFDCSNLGGLDCVGKVFGDIGTLFKITITSPINNINNLIKGLGNIKYNTCNTTTGQNKIFTGTITTGQNNLLNKVFSQKINLIDYIMNFIIILFVIIWIYFIF